MPTSRRLGDKGICDKIRATRAGPLERAEQSSPIKGATGGQAVYRATRWQDILRTDRPLVVSSEQSGVVNSVCACALKRMTRRREEPRGVIRKLLENDTVQGRRDGVGTVELAWQGSALHTPTPRDYGKQWNYAPVCLPYMWQLLRNMIITV
ncbi:hypothetical protein T10_10942 [Trichinella papuae]|uniref:Uncharacterized protein n=1 Tax=Trichinella papuae TaxID=268474 RepID=A0A0V1MEX0_9BILA|nr:hypothetical protein T10_10942 [Trichinella papuae]